MVIIEARYDTSKHRPLFALASYDRCDPASLKLVRVTFDKEGMIQNFCHIMNLTNPLHALDKMTGYVTAFDRKNFLPHTVT